MIENGNACFARRAGLELDQAQCAASCQAVPMHFWLGALERIHWETPDDIEQRS